MFRRWFRELSEEARHTSRPAVQEETIDASRAGFINPRSLCVNNRLRRQVAIFGASPPRRTFMAVRLRRRSLELAAWRPQRRPHGFMKPALLVGCRGGALRALDVRL